MAIADVRARVTSPEAQESFKRWFDAAPIYSGTVAANRLGWQVARSLGKRGAIELRRRARGSHAPASIVDQLDRDGIVVIPGYLAPDAHAAVDEAFDSYVSSDKVRDVGGENGAGIDFRTGPVVDDGRNPGAAVINAAFGTDPMVIALAEHVIGRRVRPPLRVVLQQLELRSGQVDDSDREHELHADRAYPCVKMIYTLDPISSTSSPFVYCPGSHRMTLERLRYEHRMGVREALLRAGRVGELRPDDGIDFVKSRNVIGPELRRRLGIEERAMTCGANSLIITNNAGFHRRGRLEPGGRRRTLWVNFYPYQRPWYGKVAHRVVKAVIDTDDVTRALAPIHKQSIDETST